MVLGRNFPLFAIMSALMDWCSLRLSGDGKKLVSPLAVAEATIGNHSL